MQEDKVFFISSKNIGNERNNSEVAISGTIKNVRNRILPGGDGPYVRMTINDGEGDIMVHLFKQLLEYRSDVLQEGQLVVINGVVRRPGLPSDLVSVTATSIEAVV